MTFLQLIFWLVVIGIIVWSLQRVPVLDPEFKTIIKWVGVAAAVVLILSAFSVIGALDFNLPHWR